MHDVATKKLAITELLDSTRYKTSHYVLLIGGALLAAGAIFADSIPLLIASMIVAPLFMPNLALGFAIVARDLRLIVKFAGLLLLSCAIVLALSMLLTVLFNDLRVKDVYIIFTENRYLAIGVALVAGVIAAYGVVQPKISSALTGVAIAVSLLPPLVATGVGIASGAYDVASGAAILFGLNVGGITVASIIVFSIYGLGKAYRTHYSKV